MNLSCSYLLWCFLFCLLPFSPILSHLSILCHFNRCKVYFPKSNQVSSLWWYPHLTVYSIFLNCHHELILCIMKRDDSLLLYRVIRYLPEKNVSVCFSSTTLRSEDHHKVISTCLKKLDMNKCVSCNFIDAFWRCLDGGYTCLCICFRVGESEWGSWVLEKLSLMMFPEDTVKAYHVSTRTEFVWWCWNPEGPYFCFLLSLELL